MGRDRNYVIVKNATSSTVNYESLRRNNKSIIFRNTYLQYIQTITVRIGLIKQQRTLRAISKKGIWDFKNEVGKGKTAYIPVMDYFLKNWLLELQN